MRIRCVCMMAAVGTILTAAGSTHAIEPARQTNLEAALAKAKTEDKLLFVQYGREACGNCQALKAIIKKGQLKLSDSEFVYADVNCDDPAARQAFGARFKVDGNMLPFVVIADPAGKQLAVRTGYGTAAQFKDFVKDSTRAYEKEHKAQPAPRKTLTLPKPRASGIPPDENREMRSWTAASGTQVTAALVEERAGMVVLKKEDGSRLQIPEAWLSKADRDYLAGVREAAAKTAGE